MITIMQWVILVGDSKLNLNAIKEITHINSIATEMNGNRYYVDFGEDHIFYDDQEDVLIEEYDQEELNKIPFTNPHFILMIYQSEKRMKSILRQDDFLRGIYIDDDYGKIVPIEEFIK
jgi:hypothetical protein